MCLMMFYLVSCALSSEEYKTCEDEVLHENKIKSDLSLSFQRKVINKNIFLLHFEHAIQCHSCFDKIIKYLFSASLN